MTYDYFSPVPQFGTVTESLPLRSGDRYTLVIRDHGGDGFAGKIQVIATVNGVEQALVDMLGNIGWYHRVSFIAP